jgi:hypothetical protein
VIKDIKNHTFSARINEEIIKFFIEGVQGVQGIFFGFFFVLFILYDFCFFIGLCKRVRQFVIKDIDRRAYTKCVRPFKTFRYWLDVDFVQYDMCYNHIFRS